MTDKKVQTEKAGLKSKAAEVSAPLEHIFLAGLGALSNAQKLGSKTFETLVEEGEFFRKDASEKTEALIGDVQKSIRNMAGDAQHRRPLLHECTDSALAVVHAGLPPAWDLDTARACARELEAVLAGDGLDDFLARMYGNEPRCWSHDLRGHARLRFITNAFTRLRYCDADGCLVFAEKRPPGRQAAGLAPWFAAPGRRSRGARIVFGHWATLQLETPLDPRHGVWHVDTGCVWGGPLTALREDDLTVHRVPGLEADMAARRRGGGA